MNTKPFISIRIKVLILLSVCIMIPFAFYWFFSYEYIRTSLDEEFVSQSTDVLTSSGNSISDYLRLADYTARGLYFNSEVMDILSGEEDSLSDYQLLQTESRIFDFMQMLFSSLPESSQIHLSAFHLKKSLLLQQDMQRYEKDHIYLNAERTFPCEPYHTYVSPTHMQSDYNFLNLANRKFNLVFTIHMPIYQIPSATDSLGELSIDIPISVLEEMCHSLLKKEESLCILDSDGNYIYSSNPSEIATKTKSPILLDILSSDLDYEKAHLIETQKDNLIICSRIPLEPFDWYLIKISPKDFVYAKANHFFNLMFYSFITVTAAELLLIFITAIRLTRPLKQATAYAEAVSQGNLNTKMSSFITYTQNDEIGRMLIAIRKMIHSIRHFTIHQYQLELANRTSELKALQAQINPHFIHNTLQCLATNALEGGNLPLYQSITFLGQMMHYSMDTRQSLVPIIDSLHYIDVYLQLQQMRFPSNMTSVFEIPDEVKSMLIPKMTLQPLVENSIRHGNLLKIENGRLVIRAYRQERYLHIFVEDNGIGMSFEKLSQINKSLEQVRSSMANSDVKGFVSSLNLFSADSEEYQPIEKAKEQRFVSNSIGIYNVYQRLLLYFKNQCTMYYESNDTCGTTVHIQIDYDMLEENTASKEI